MHYGTNKSNLITLLLGVFIGQYIIELPKVREYNKLKEWSPNQMVLMHHNHGRAVEDYLEHLKAFTSDHTLTPQEQAYLNNDIKNVKGLSKAYHKGANTLPWPILNEQYRLQDSIIQQQTIQLVQLHKNLTEER